MKNKQVYKKYTTNFKKRKGALVSIVTTAYNNEKFNRKYFETVNDQTYKHIEVIFVDNLSSDNTKRDALNRLKNGKIVVSKINLGCAGGNNLGVLEATGKYIFLLGPDTWVDKNCVKTLVKSAEHNDNNIYTPKQITYDGKEFISCGIAADLFGYPARTYTRDGNTRIKRVFYADGTGVFMTRENYLKIGMMDESTFLFAEDVDLSWKGHLFGLDVIPVPNSVVYHFSGGSVGIGGYPKGQKYETNSNRRFLAERNIIRNILKNYYLWNLLWILPYYITINICEAIALAVTGQFSPIYKTYLKAYFWNIANWKSTMKKRKLIQTNRTVSDIDILKKMYYYPHKFLALIELGVPKIK